MGTCPCAAGHPTYPVNPLERTENRRLPMTIDLLRATSLALAFAGPSLAQVTIATACISGGASAGSQSQSLPVGLVPPAGVVASAHGNLYLGCSADASASIRPSGTG